jgi:hypothetical protein
MATNTYVAGAVVRLSAAFTASAVATDPSTVTLTIRTPSPGLTTLTYAGAQITRDSTGNYHYDLTTTISGVYAYRWVAGGAVVAAAEGQVITTSLNFV